MKYLKPKSVTWWAGLVPLIGGVIVAAGDTISPALSPLAAFINAMSGDMSAAVMIGWGAGLIGLRGAV